MRIIAGTLKGRRLPSPTWPGLRPTADRLRETLFNVLGGAVAGAEVLDGCAGTGALGLEALSRGAAHATFVDRDARAAALIAANLERCRVAGRGTVVRGELPGALDRVAAAAFDLALLDPPYEYDDRALGALLAAVGRRTAAGGQVVVERTRRAGPVEAAPLTHVRRVTAGNSVLDFHVRTEEQAGRPSTRAGRSVRPDLAMSEPRSRLAVYPGSFDPLTNGHVDIIRRGARLFDRIVIAVLVNVDKSPLFSPDERVEIAREVFRRDANVEVETFHGLLVDYAARRGADVIVRGLRAISDFEFEMQMALMNRRLSQSIETVFMMPDERYTYLSSRLAKEVFALGGSLDGLVPEIVEARLRRKAGARAPGARA